MILSAIQIFSAFALFVLALAHIVFVLRHSQLFMRVGLSFLVLMLYTLYLFLLTIDQQTLPLRTANQVFQSVGWVLMIFLIAVEFLTQKKLLASLFFPFACLLGIMGIVFSRMMQLVVYRPAIEFLGSWQDRFFDLQFGTFFLIVGYSALFYAFLVAFFSRMMFVEIQEKKSVHLIKRLPSIATLESFLTFFLAVFLVMLAIVFACKYLLAEFAVNYALLFPGLLPKQPLLPSLLAWLVVLFTLVLRANLWIDSKTVLFSSAGALFLVLINLFY